MLLGYKSSTESLFISLPNDATLVSNYEVRRLETYLAFGRTPHRHSPPPSCRPLCAVRCPPILQKAFVLHAALLQLKVCLRATDTECPDTASSDQLASFLSYVKTLGYTDRPDYRHLKQLLASAGPGRLGLSVPRDPPAREKVSMLMSSCSPLWMQCVMSISQ